MGDTQARVCRLMARLEESEHGDMALARDWLMRASTGAPDPAWVCTACGHVSGGWIIDCGNCHAFDSFSWRTPSRGVVLDRAMSDRAMSDRMMSDAGPDITEDLPAAGPVENEDRAATAGLKAEPV